MLSFEINKIDPEIGFLITISEFEGICALRESNAILKLSLRPLTLKLIFYCLKQQWA